MIREGRIAFASTRKPGDLPVRVALAAIQGMVIGGI
jgi:hypothetical protein